MPLAELNAVLLEAGWPRERLQEAVNIVNCESSLDPTATNDIGAGHTGLFQISGVHGHSREALMDPAYNATVALGLWREQGWAPWECARNFGYDLSAGAPPRTDGGDEGLLSDLGAAGAGAAAGLTDTLGALTPDGLADLVRDVGFAIVLLMGGTALVVLAARAFASPGREQRDAIKSQVLDAI